MTKKMTKLWIGVYFDSLILDLLCRVAEPNLVFLGYLDVMHYFMLYFKTVPLTLKDPGLLSNEKTQFSRLVVK